MAREGGIAPATLFSLHATFMILAWICFAGIGQLCARYMKRALSKNGKWFKIHMAMLSLTAVSSFIGFMFAFRDTDWKFCWQRPDCEWDFAGWHGACGLAALSAMLGAIEANLRVFLVQNVFL